MGRGKVNTVVGADTFSQELEYDHVNMMIKNYETFKWNEKSYSYFMRKDLLTLCLKTQILIWSSLNDIHYKLMILGSLISIKQLQSHAWLALLVHNVHFCHWILTRLIMHYLKLIHAPSPQKKNFDKIILKKKKK